MSAQPSEEIGPEGRWFGDDFGENGLSGNAPSRFDGLHDDFKPRGNEKTSDLDQPFRSSQDEGKRPVVAMETASTGYDAAYCPAGTSKPVTNARTLIAEPH